MELVWQVRHTMVHNVGIVTASDAIKFRLMIREPVGSPLLIQPTVDDLRLLKRFLDEMAEVANERVGPRLAEVLTVLHARDATLFVPQEMADRMAATFGMPLVVAGATGVVPPP